MPSPFPGTNPYLEQTSCWETLHQSLAVAIVGELVPQLRPRYLVKLEQRLHIHEKSAEERRYFGRSVVGVADGSQRATTTTAGILATATHAAAPVYGLIPAAVEIEKQAYVEITDRERQRVVTSIEILSPTNKWDGEDREQYLVQRRAVLHSSLHLVEIDLLRGGPRMPTVDLPECDYCVLVSRAHERPRVELWPWRLRDEIPPTPIPVNPGDQDARLDLKPLLERLHDDSDSPTTSIRARRNRRCRPMSRRGLGAAWNDSRTRPQPVVTDMLPLSKVALDAPDADGAYGARRLTRATPLGRSVGN